MNGWIKLYRKLWQSTSILFQGKNKAERILTWIWMLTYANENGLVRFGRHQVAHETGLSDQQVKRIVSSWSQKATNEVTIKATNQYTELLILNWDKHQSNPTKKATNEVIAKRPTSDQQATTNKNKNKEVRSKEYSREWLSAIPQEDKIYFSEKYQSIDLQDQIERAINWLNMNGKRYKNYKAFLDNWCRKANEWAKDKQKIESDDVKIPDYLKPFEEENAAASVG